MRMTAVMKIIVLKTKWKYYFNCKQRFLKQKFLQIEAQLL